MPSMRMQAGLLPPPEVQDDLAAAVASVKGSAEQLDEVPARNLYLRLANFGKVSLQDAQGLRSTLDREVGQWPAMRFRFKSGIALDPIGDDSAWALLDGDIEQLSDLVGLVLRSVKRLGFLVDRRLPRTRMRLGRINPATTEPYLMRLIECLEGYSGPDWICRDLVLLKVTDSVDAGAPDIEVFHRLELEAADPLSGGSRRS